MYAHVHTPQVTTLILYSDTDVAFSWQRPKEKLVLRVVFKLKQKEKKRKAQI